MVRVCYTVDVSKETYLKLSSLMMGGNPRKVTSGIATPGGHFFALISWENNIKIEPLRGVWKLF